MGGQHISDAYFIASTMFTGTRKPRLLVYGIAPRDFCDNSLKTPVSTLTFRYLSRFYNVFNVPALSFVSFDEWVPFCLGRISFLYDRKDALVRLSSLSLQAELKNYSGLCGLPPVVAGQPSIRKQHCARAAEERRAAAA